ncbi:MAG: hypothetical protein LBU77_07430 [Clostridiales bacterium]|jgi:hypothetical protein|nr:hypothetical protein [Clostridiales bacterium]
MAQEFSHPFNASFDEEGMPILNEDGEPDRLYDANDEAHADAIKYTDGVYLVPATNLKVYENGGMSVVVRQGSAIIAGRKYELWDGDMELDVPAAHASYPRKDIVVLRLDVTEAVKAINIIYRAGTAANNPTAPALLRTSDQWELLLAEIEVLAGAKTVTQSKIHDTRYEGLCGVSSYRGNPLDLTDIFNQFDTFLAEQIVAWLNRGIKADADFATFLQKIRNEFDALKSIIETWQAGLNANITRAAGFNFDNLANQMGCTKTTTFSGGQQIETIVFTGSGAKSAERITDYTALTTTETLYDSDGSETVIRTSTVQTSFKDGTIEEVVR